MKPEFVKLAQRIIKTDPDGDFGSNSKAAAFSYTLGVKTKGKMTSDRWIALVIQVCYNRATGNPAIDQDGWFGPDTKDAAYRLLGETFARPDEQPKIDHPPKCWIPTEAQCTKKFGSVGTNQVLAQLPFAMRLDWDLKTRVTRASCHKDFEKPLQAALEAIRDHYGVEKIRSLNIDRFGGILNVRKKRGGSTWSAHAWGTAIDLWPDANQLTWHKDRAAFAKEDYAVMRSAFADAGLMSLGTCYNFDWMHFQLNP